MHESITLALVIVVTSALTVLGVHLLIRAWVGARRQSVTAKPASDPMFFLDDDGIFDSNEPAQSLLTTLRAADKLGRGDRALLFDHLERLLPGFRLAVDDLGDRSLLKRRQGDTSVQVKRIGEALHLSILDLGTEGGSIGMDRQTFRALNDEIDMLRALADHAPLPIWSESEDGCVTWANGFYLHLLARVTPGSPLSWPLPTLFPATDPAGITRVSVRSAADPKTTEWYDVSRAMTAQGLFSFALPANAAQAAEATKRDFIQTLTKTFSTLPIGLAVFDKNRRMQLFNPALLDLTGLEPEFLLTHPRIEGLLNRLRERHVMPEPRDYAQWIKTLLSLNTEQRDFEETWVLPGGRTLRFRASPHPDGSLAFMIEDISTEARHSAQQNAVAETGQSVIDTLDDAVAVFAPGGALLMTNTAFSRLWMLDDEPGIEGLSLTDALMTWAEESEATDLWRRIADLATTRNRAQDPVSGEMVLDSRDRLSVCAHQTSTGSLVVRFSQNALLPHADVHPPTAHRAAG